MSATKKLRPFGASRTSCGMDGIGRWMRPRILCRRVEILSRSPENSQLTTR